MLLKGTERYFKENLIKSRNQFKTKVQKKLEASNGIFKTLGDYGITPLQLKYHILSYVTNLFVCESKIFSTLLKIKTMR